MDPKRLVKRVENLISLPEVCLRINEVMYKPSTTAADLGEIIALDPALTTRLLKIVNSAFYNFPSKISTVSHAITIIGTRELRDLVLATSAVGAFKNIPNKLVDMEAFWYHSVFCGIVCRVLATEIRQADGERLFVAGLLHDIGKLIIYHQLPEESQQILEYSEGNDVKMLEKELELLGFNHADVGRELMSQWGLPERFCEVVGSYYSPLECQDYITDACVVHVANDMAMAIESGTNVEQQAAEYAPGFDPNAWRKLELSKDRIEPIMIESCLKAFEVSEIISPGSTLIY